MRQSPGAALDVRFYGGAGAVCSTAHDLLRWQDALFGGKVLSPAGLATMTTPGTLADGSGDLVRGRPDRGSRVHASAIWHNGGVPEGYESQLDWYPDDRLQIVLLTNTVNMPPGATLGALEHALAVEHLHITVPKPLDIALGSAALAAYVGRYATAPAGRRCDGRGKPPSRQDRRRRRR